jgi:hypothetical protein
MAGYLDNYGVAEQKRERLTKRVLIATGSAIVLGLLLFLFFRNFAEKRAFSHFLDAVRANQYQDAYRLWGCTPQNPCRDYSFERFMDDWGPKGQYANARNARVVNVDACGEGVVLTLQVPNLEPVGIWVERKTGTLGFAPWPRCPGRHWQFGELWKRIFG